MVYSPKKLEATGVEDLDLHYRQEDPHKSVAASKKDFFSYVLEHLEAVRTQAGAKILDVGCGFGYFLEVAAAREWEPYGVDIVGDAVSAARRKFGEDRVFCGGVTEAELPDGMFGAVTLWDVLMFSRDPAEDLVECRRILAPGGVLGIRVRNFLFQETLFRAFDPVKNLARKLGIKNPTVFHPLCFTPTALRTLMLRAGFEDVRVTNSPLTRSDPYRFSEFGGITVIAKSLAAFVSRVVFTMSGGRQVLGPSLLAWGRKPL